MGFTRRRADVCGIIVDNHNDAILATHSIAETIDRSLEADNEVVLLRLARHGAGVLERELAKLVKAAEDKERRRDYCPTPPEPEVTA